MKESMYVIQTSTDGKACFAEITEAGRKVGKVNDPPYWEKLSLWMPLNEIVKIIKNQKEQTNHDNRISKN